VRITYDPEVDAAYIYLTDEQLPPGPEQRPGWSSPEAPTPTSCSTGGTPRWLASRSWAPLRISTPTC